MRLLTLSLFGALCMMGGPLGKPLELKQRTAIADLEKKPGDFVGKTVQVRGRITEVCEKMGCWMNLVDPDSNAKVRIKVKDGEIHLGCDQRFGERGVERGHGSTQGWIATVSAACAARRAASAASGVAARLKTKPR